jgi:hypothetical protein
VSDPNAISPTAERGFLANFFIKNAPYIILLLLAVIGVAYTDLSPARSFLYWQAMVPVFAVLCIIARWRRVEPNTRSRLHLIWEQLLHWGALLLVMRVLFVHDVQRLLDSDIAGLLLIYLLALTTFLGGIYLDWRLCVVGVFLGLGAVALAFLDEAALPMLGLAVIIVLVLALWSRLRRKTQSP